MLNDVIPIFEINIQKIPAITYVLFYDIRPSYFLRMKLHNYQVLVFKNTMRFEASDPVRLCQEVMSWKIPWTLLR